MKRRTGKRSRNAAPVAATAATEAQCHEPFPQVLLHALHQLADHAGTPPSKRRRIEQVESIPVLRESFIIARPSAPVIEHEQIRSLTCEDAGCHLRLNLEGRTLVIQSNPKAPCDRFKTSLYLDGNLPKAVEAALTVLCQSRDDKTEEGALTVKSTITLEEKDDLLHMKFDLDVNWNVATYAVRNSKQRSQSQNVLGALADSRPDPSLADQSSSLQPQAFYEAAFVPDPDDYKDLDTVPIPGLTAKLYPFQRRSLQWLLMREGVKCIGTGAAGELRFAPHPLPPQTSLPLSFKALEDVNGQQYYVSELYHIVTRDIARFQEGENSFRGGILAEEMGLGKTVETISLILSHQRDIKDAIKNNGQSRPTGATLIVTPDTLANQWISEFEKHAPRLLVVKYPGMKVWADAKTLDKEGRNKDEDLSSEFVDRLANCDVVITTYNVLQREIHYTTGPPQRTTRSREQRHRRTSPLIELGWWRVCLDEAQQVDSGVSNAAKVARLIPRVHSWAVTGTPVKDDINDLWGLLLFLHYEPFASSQLVWKAMLNAHATFFRPLFNKISLRHSKAVVRAELKLPAQRRYVVTMPLTSIERHNYETQLKASLEKAGLSEDGTPTEPDWNPDSPSVIDAMKKALANLRQLILHPELGSKRAKVVMYKTLTQQLEVMIERARVATKTAQRLWWHFKVVQGQLLDDTPKVKDALPIWEDLLKQITPAVLDARKELQVALEHNDQVQVRKQQGNIDGNKEDPGELEEGETPETTKVSDCRRHLRLLLELEQRVRFFMASAFFQIKSKTTEKDSAEFQRLEQLEVEGYEQAQALRLELLQEPLAKVSRLMDKLKARAETQEVVEIPEIDVSELHGLEGESFGKDLITLGNSLNTQAKLVGELRDQVIHLLLKPLVDGESADEVTGDEFEDSKTVQDYLMVHTQVLNAVVGDRAEALNGLKNERIVHEISMAERMAKDDEGHAPEKLLKLLEQRQKAMTVPRGVSLRGIIGLLRSLSTRLRNTSQNESGRPRLYLNAVLSKTGSLQDILMKQVKAHLGLEKELELFTSVMNARVAYYRHLQEISNGLAPLDIDSEAHRVRLWDDALRREYLAERDYLSAQGNHRHLLSLQKEELDVREPCPICQDIITMGSLTSCGHRFCRECIAFWLRNRRTCPICKNHQTEAMLVDFSDLPALRIRREKSVGATDSGPLDRSQGPGIYSDFDEAKLQAIRDIPLTGPAYSTKVDTLIRHLLWLREEDAGAKSIIFSQFRGFLTLLKQAFQAHGIGCAAFTSSGDKAKQIQRFKDDPATDCLLMDAKVHSNGLNLVNASHVFLCEPLLNTALELQAIARVDRIGQAHETTVWLYLADDTIEENIYRLSQKRRLAHIVDVTQQETTALEPATLEDANSRELEQAGITTNLMSKSEEGEVVDKGDLWECLFGTEASS
ncbi:SNF2 family N-terminal domain-containing protein [Poronia punctata]|nr:SNF2 family N-terminal domain-containing protein [Poronia punctata]